MSYRKLIISAVLTCVFVIGSGLFLIGKTEIGSKILINSIVKLSGGEVSYAQMQGHLLGQLTIKDFKYTAKSNRIEIKELSLNSSLKIFSLELFVKQLHINNMMIMTTGRDKTASAVSMTMPSFVNLSLNDIEINNIVIRQNTRTIMQIPHIKLDGLLTHRQIRADIQVSDNHQGKIIIQLINKNNHYYLKTISQEIDLQDFWPNYWPTQMNFDLEMTHNDTETTIKLNDLNSIINGKKLSGAGELITQQQKISTLNINIRSDQSSIVANQDREDSNKIDYAIHIPKLQQFLPKSNGEIVAKGYIDVTSHMEGDFSVKQINSPALQCQKASGQVLLNFRTPAQTSYCSVIADKIVFKKMTIDSLKLEGHGSLKKHDIKLTANLKEQSAHIAAIGKYENPQWLVTFTEFTIKQLNDSWHLKNNANLTLDKNNFSLESFCLMSNQGQLFIDTTYPFGHQMKGKLVLDNFDLSLLNFLLPINQKLTGKLNLLAVNDAINRNNFKLQANLKSGTYYYLLDKKQQKLDFFDGKLDSKIQQKDFANHFEIFMPEGQVVGSLTLPNFEFHKNSASQTIRGDLNIKYNSPKILEFLIPVIKNVSGNITGQYLISGTVATPLISGKLALANGSFSIPKLNLPVNHVNIEAKNAGNDIQLQGELSSGSGKITFNGHSAIKKDGLPINLDLQGDNVLICNKTDIKIIATPKMHISLINDELALSGNILIPEANLRSHDFGDNNSLSDDIIFIEPNGKPAKNSNLKIKSSLHLTLGDKIFLNTPNIKGQVLGDLQIEDDPHKATMANGQLWLHDGTYSVYGKTLQIDDGKLLFIGGPISNPGLDIKASRTIQVNNDSLFTSNQKFKAGVSVSGTLKNPKINLFSEPAGKDPADILSYLILGVPVKSVDPTSTALLLQAADAVNLSGESKIANLKNKIKQGLGLSELDLGAQSQIDPNTRETVQHTAFVLGKYLSPKFYINYSLDLFDHTNTFKARYFLNRFWTIQSITNTNRSGIDLLYTIEK